MPDPTGAADAAGTASSAEGGSPPDPATIADLVAARASVLTAIDAACARSGRDPSGVTLVAVSKTVGVSRLRAAVAAGLVTRG